MSATWFISIWRMFSLGMCRN